MDFWVGTEKKAENPLNEVALPYPAAGQICTFKMIPLEKKSRYQDRYLDVAVKVDPVDRLKSEFFPILVAATFAQPEVGFGSYPTSEESFQQRLAQEHEQNHPGSAGAVDEHRRWVVPEVLQGNFLSASC